jgi:AcrR family transcriptional regulator
VVAGSSQRKDAPPVTHPSGSPAGGNSSPSGGYEETTVADIAGRAEVSVRTFFLHFPFKEAVLFDGSLDGYPELHRLVVSAPEHLSDLAALEYALVSLHTSVGVDQDLSHRMVQLLVKADAASSVVRGRRMENAARVAEAVGRALAERRGGRG